MMHQILFYSRSFLLFLGQLQIRTKYQKRTNITTTNRGESFIARIGSTENFISYCRRLAMMTTVMFSSLMLQLPLEKHHSSQSN